MYLRSDTKKKDGFFEIARTVFYAVLIALGIRTVAFEPFNIPSESMLPTLLVGDYLFVSKYTYGYSRYSLPLGLYGFPIGISAFPDRILGSLPERGDIAVFKLPRDNSTDYIKRIVGLPGDRVQMKSGQMFLNGEAVERRRVGDFVHRDRFGNVMRLPQFVERLPGGRSYPTLDLQPRSSADDTDVFTVPPGHYFVLGDNRDNSLDSRFSPAAGGVGFVPAVNLVGRAEMLFFSTDGGAAWWEVWKWPFSTRYERLFGIVR